ncbi:MAG TPA: hypothetical protein VND80_05145 [Steroidobacteraceae bacterium]|nr:hypothetical protein [Steroidobacteraceae bacterium]
MLRKALSLWILILLAATSPAFAQPALSALQPLPASSIATRGAADAPRIDALAIPSHPLSVVGPRGALLGFQDGSYEAWVFPWKLLANMRITVRMQGYPVPIDVNGQASGIRVRPWATTITYSHANFTIRQIMLAPQHAADDSGAIVLYQIEAVRPMTLTFSFDPKMQRMWPAPSDGPVSPEWVPTAGGSGFYILHLNFPQHTAALALPTARPGILAPYQERAKYWPLQFVLRFDPKRDAHRLFPLLMVLGQRTAGSSPAALARKLAALDGAVRQEYRATRRHFRHLLATRTRLMSPDARLNAAFAWAEVAIDQLRVEATPGHREEALTAGFVNSGDSARPGFGWFFGRDALWTLYAVDSDGDFRTARHEFEFLFARQRADGKIMHEYAQTAALVDWGALPYEYAAADSTPLLIMAAADYLHVSGDRAFIAAHWANIAKAWHFETMHVSTDGFFNNSQGTGWVESWVPRMPEQEIYLAALDQQASAAMADLARATGHEDLASAARARAQRLARVLQREYYEPRLRFYAFSHNADGSVDPTPTIFPSVAFWDGDLRLAADGPMLRRWASSEFSTDWGARDVGDHVSFYDPISYHQGSVWPLFTGWLSVAEYRAGQPLAGEAALMQNANLTFAQDLGSVTELLSGHYFQVLGRSTAHQLWSSAMVISPVLRGMFGLRWDAAGRVLSVTPQLPATWRHAVLRHVPFGDSTVTLSFTRSGAQWLVAASGKAAADLHLESRARGAKLVGDTLHIPLPAVEISIPHHRLPQFGATTRQMKVLDEQYTNDGLTLELAAPGGTRATLEAHANLAGLNLRASGAALGPPDGSDRLLTVSFPPGAGYVERAVRLAWSP